MRRRIIAMFVVCIFICTLTGCEEGGKSEIVTLPNHQQSDGQVTTDGAFEMQLLETIKVEEYLTFLESFDYTNYQILGISTSMYTGPYTDGNYYMVTYSKLEEPREARETGKVSLFKTTDYDEYNSFLNSFDTFKYEILDISTSMSTGPYTSGNYYMVTYIEIK